MKKRLIYTIAIVFVVFTPTGLFAQDPNMNTTTESNNLFKETLKKAENGDHEAQINIAVMYFEGKSVTLNLHEGAKWFERAAEHGSAFEQYLLGGWYYKGDKYFPQNYEKAAKWYTKSALQGYVDAQFRIGVIYDSGEGIPINYKEAVKWYIKAAEQGYAPAQFRLGLMYESGCEGLPLDVKKAIDWYSKSAEQGYASAQCNLGVIYYNGDGVTQNYNEAVKWHTKASERGNSGAQKNLGIMYLKGEGVTEDYVEAYKWFLLAGKNGQDVSLQKEYLQSKMSSDQIAEAQQHAKEYKPQNTWQSEVDTEISADMAIRNSGTGFFISYKGYLLTAYHVVDKAKAIKINTGKQLLTAKVIRTDATNDIALLKIDVVGSDAIAIQSSRDVKVGQDVFTLGFPNIQFQGTEAKYTQGNISSLSGLGDDPRLFQISTAVQPGNSGGPLLDGDGQVVGLVVAKLDEIAMAQETGSLPQNVNYALKSSFVLSFLESLPELNGKLVEPKKAGLSRIQIIEKTSRAVVMVLCY